MWNNVVYAMIGSGGGRGSGGMGIGDLGSD